jgi:sphinganine-1-phosphate aldolase
MYKIDRTILTRKIQNRKTQLAIIFFFSLIYKQNDLIRHIYYFKNFIMYENKIQIIRNKFYGIFYKLPYIKDKVKKEVSIFNNNMKSELSKKHEPYNLIIEPDISLHGLSESDLVSKLNKLKTCGVNKELKFVSGAIYNKNEKEIDLMKKILPFFFKSNPLHPELFPQISFLEKNIIKSVAKLFHGDKNVAGCITSGGTESIICACYAYKKYGLNKGIKNPEIIAPVSIHAAFDKAANFFGIKLNKIPINLDNTIDFNILKSYINNNTILLACSAPSYAHGLIDDIESFSKIALKYNIPLHVDACLGGFLLPFAENKVKYDFELEGVTSISADTHKYGYTPKGSSILLYRNSELYKNQIFVQSQWNGGIYATPTIPGSRSGNNIVFTWAFLNYYGINGYKEKTKLVVDTLHKIKKRIINISEIEIIGDPVLNVIGIKSDVINIYSLNSEMRTLGWELNELQNPQSLHFCITLNNTKDSTVDKFCNDLNISIQKCLNNPINDSGKSVYSSTQKINNEKIIEDLAKEYIKNLSN